mmetsp:Transcript_7939/g.13163  ORF Transcript_7939/g.13163 Transcript_7939/m.13163 type:complete len:211 (+) Transcript_7939:159-791(+)
MSIFDAYDTEFGSLKDELAKDIAQFKEKAENDDDPTSLVQLIDGLFLQSHDLIKQMELEARSSDSGVRKKLNEVVLRYKTSMQKMKSDYQQSKTSLERSQLMNKSKGVEQRQRLLDTNDRLDRQNEMISNAHRMVSETEQVGMEITAELTRNREKLESSREKAAEYAGISDSARRMISSIGRREARQKYMAIFALVGLVVVIIVLIVYHQ